MHRVAHDGFSSYLVERLYVDEAFDESFLVQLHHVSSDSAESERSFDALLDHLFTDVLHGSERCTARTRLNGESIAEVTTVDNHLGSLLRQQDVAWIFGVADSTRRNLR